MSRRPQKKHPLAGLAFAGMVAVALTGVHHHHHHLSFGLPRLTASTARPANANAALAQRLAAREYGWTGGQWGCLDNLWQGESGFSNTADTRASGLDPAGAAVFAYGIPQARGHGAQVGGVTAPYPAPYQAANPPDAGGTSDARAQIKWGLGYIHGTYGSPCAALSFKRSTGNQGY